MTDVVHYPLPALAQLRVVFYADKLMAMCNSKNFRVFNFTILHLNRENLVLAIYPYGLLQATTGDSQ